MLSVNIFPVKNLCYTVGAKFRLSITFKNHVND